MNTLRSTAVVAAVAVLSLSAVAFADSPPAGQQLFESKCAVCHGKDGAGQTAMGKKLALKDLRSPEVQKMTDAGMIELTTKGKGKMPAFKGKLTDAQITDIIAYIRTLKK